MHEPEQARRLRISWDWRLNGTSVPLAARVRVATRPQHACNTHVQVLASLQFFLDQADTLSDTSAAAAGGRDVNAMYEEMKKDPKMQVPIRKCVRVRRAVGAVGSLGTGRGCAQCMRGWNVNVAHSSVCMAGM